MRLEHILAKKRKLWRTYKRTKRAEVHQRFIEVRREADAAIAIAKRRYEERLASRIKEDPKSFFAYARSKQNTKASVRPLKKGDGTLAVDDAESAELLNAQFSSVFMEEDLERVPEPVLLFQGTEEEKLRDVTFTVKKLKHCWRESRLIRPKDQMEYTPVY